MALLAYLAHLERLVVLDKLEYKAQGVTLDQLVL